jgi:hypothetical protein
MSKKTEVPQVAFARTPREDRLLREALREALSSGRPARDLLHARGLGEIAELLDDLYCGRRSKPEIPALSERLDTISDALTLIQAVGLSDVTKWEQQGLSEAEVLRVISDAACKASLEMWWLTKNLPPSVLAIPAPDDDQKQAGGAR